MNFSRLYIYKLIIMLVILLGAANIFSMTQFQNDQKVSDFAKILKQKVLLNNDQELKIIDILSELQKNIQSKPEKKSEFINDAQTKVERLLDNKQKMKYDIIKNDLWKKVL